MTLALQLPCLRCPSRPDTPSLAGTPPPQPFVLQRLCSKLRLSLLVLGFNILLLVAVCVMGSHNSKFQRDLATLRTTFSNFTSNATAEVQALKSQGEPGMEGALDWGSQNNCCPTSWLEHEGKCYWVSSSGKPWPEAEKYCQLEDAYLVVINSREEQDFVQAHIGSSYTWMGLSDLDGVWKWADGTDYETNFKNWKPGQPDDWQGHGLGGGEDCAHFHPDGKWNDDACQRPYHWICEAGLSKGS
uniref:Asialoglycoprotein receptor 2 n=1 Tax=Balaenoptera musculus TaxID=9771 RepID=A0A8C0E0Y1_BALMU